MRKFLIAAVVAVTALAVAAVAVASDQFSQTASVKFTTKKRHANSGARINLEASDPGAPNKKPSPATRVRVIFPKGTKINTSAAKVCKASDSAFGEKGAKACPAGSRLGTGTAQAITGLGAPIDPVGEKITAFAGKRQIIFYLQPDANSPAGQTLVIRAKVRGRVVDTKVPPVPVPGLGNASLTRFKVNLKAYAKGRGKKQKRVLTTPSKCGKGHNWVTTTKFNYEDGTSATIKSRSNCR